MNQKTFVIDSDPKCLKPFRTQLSKWLKSSDISETNINNLLLALGEACANSIRHSYHNEKGHKIKVAVRNLKGKIVFKIRDYGEKINFSKIKTPELPPKKPHGLGVYFLKTVVDELKYNTSHSRGNELILIKYKDRNGKL